MTTTIGERRGKQRNLTAEALGERTTLRRAGERVPNPRPCVVDDYDFSLQRVDVRFKDQPDSPVVKGVPIDRAGKPYGLIAPFSRGDVGLLVPLWTDGRNAWEDGERRLPASRLRNAGISWIFVPGPKLRTAPLPDFANADATSSDLHQLGPGDASMFSADGKSGVIFKSGGEVVFIGDSFYLLGIDQDATDAKGIARVGDNVSSGSITSGSDIANAG